MSKFSMTNDDMKKSFLLVSFLIFSFFIFFSYLVHKNIFIQFDFDTTVRLQDNISRRFDDFFSFISEVGKFEPMVLFLILILVIRRKIWGFMAFGFFSLLHVIELYGKFFIDHLPPPQFMLRVKHLFDFPQFHVRSEFSYPSGHSARAAFLTIFLGLIVWRSKKLSSKQKVFVFFALSLYDIAIFVSRVYLGEHWATDVIGGALLGLSLGLLAAFAI